MNNLILKVAHPILFQVKNLI